MIESKIVSVNSKFALNYSLCQMRFLIRFFKKWLISGYVVKSRKNIASLRTKAGT